MIVVEEQSLQREKVTFLSQVLSSFLGTSVAILIWALVGTTLVATKPNHQFDGRGLGYSSSVKVTDAPSRNREEGVGSARGDTSEFKSVTSPAESEDSQIPSLTQSSETKAGEVPDGPSVNTWVAADPEMYPLAAVRKDDSEVRNIGDPTITADVD